LFYGDDVIPDAGNGVESGASDAVGQFLGYSHQVFARQVTLIVVITEYDGIGDLSIDAQFGEFEDCLD
jgi:hypothetical protein